MPKVEIYTSSSCGYCTRAKSLLTQKGVAFHEVDVSRDQGARQAMMQSANGAYTVPQIFIGGRHIGGCDDLHALEQAGRLGGLLAG